METILKLLLAIVLLPLLIVVYVVSQLTITNNSGSEDE